MTFSVRRFGGAEWREFREIRLRMLADTPIAYGETLANARSLDDEAWMMRAERNAEGTNIGLAAVDEAGSWLGVMRGYVDVTSGPMLVGVFVDPAARGRHAGIADSLLDGIVTWAKAYGDALTLHVHTQNPRAIAFYARRGFVDTGRTVEYSLPPYGLESEMRLAV